MVSKIDLLAEHEAMLEVYETRIARAKIVRSRYAAERKELDDELAYVWSRLVSLQKEYETAPQVLEEYIARLADGRKIVSELRAGGMGITKDSSGTRKPKSRVDKALALQAELKKMLREDPSLHAVLREQL